MAFSISSLFKKKPILTGNLNQTEQTSNYTSPLTQQKSSILSGLQMPNTSPRFNVGLNQGGQPVTAQRAQPTPKPFIGPQLNSMQSNTQRSSSFDPSVLAQQQALNAKGAGLKLDGIMGPLTQAAIQKYSQPQQNIPQNNTFDPNNPPAPIQAPLNPYRPENAINPGTTPINTQAGNTSNIGGNTPNTGLSALESQFQALQTPSTEEQRLSNEQIALEDSYRQGSQNIADKRIPMSFITGQQRSLENRAINQQIPLQQKLANAQAKRQASMDAVKFGIERADKRQEREDSLKGGIEGFTLGKDQARYDSQGNLIASRGASGGGDEILSIADAKALGVPYGTTQSQALQQGKTPGVDTEKAGLRADRAITQANTALESFDDIFNNPALTKWAGTKVIARMLPGTAAKDLQASISTVKALIGFDALEKMRAASPTGGALGQISERELAYLQTVSGSLSMSQSTDQLITNLNRIKKSFEILKQVNEQAKQEGSTGTQSGSGSIFDF